MAERKLLYIDDSSGTWAEHESDDSLRLGALGIGGAPGLDGISLASGDLTLTGTGGIVMTGTTGGITNAASISLQSGGDITVLGGGTLTGLPTIPLDDTDAVSKAYVDSMVTGVSWRPPVITMEVISDALSTPPGTPADGDSYVVDGQATPYTITNVNTGTKTFTVAEDLSALLAATEVLLVAGSTGNDGYYTVVSVTYDTDHTDVVVSEVISDATVDGTLDFADTGTDWSTIGPKKIVTYDGSDWQEVRWSTSAGLQDGDRIVVKQTGVGGSFTGHESDIATWNATTPGWEFEDPDSGWAVLVQDYGNVGYWDNQGFVYETSLVDWVQFTGTGQIVAGDGLTKSGNTLNVGQGNGITVTADAVEADVNDSADPATSLANVIEVTASGIGVVGLPLEFKLGGTQVSDNVTVTNVDTLVDGISAGTFNDASLLHAHDRMLFEATAGTNGVTANRAVHVTGNDLIENAANTTEAGAEVIGISLDTAADTETARVVLPGSIARGVLGGTGTAGAKYFLSDNGALVTSIPTTGSYYVVFLGIGLNTNDLAFQVVNMGRRRAP